MAGARDEASLYHIISVLEYDSEMNKDIIKQAAFVIHFIAVEHPFKQANKRTAFFTADTILSCSGLYIKVEPEEGEKFILEVARDEHTVKEVEEWIRKRVDRLTPA
jgi:death-on-curing family protein